MPFRWRYTDRQGSEVAGPDEQFDEQPEAEAWLTDTYQELRDSGIDQVTLQQDGRTVYGPMSLHGA